MTLSSRLGCARIGLQIGRIELTQAMGRADSLYISPLKK